MSNRPASSFWREFWGILDGGAEVGADGRPAGGRGGVGVCNQIDHAIMIANGDAGMSIVAGQPRPGAGAQE